MQQVREPLAYWNSERDAWERRTVDLFSEHSDVYSETWPQSGMMRSGGVVPACAVGAPHKRARVFLVAHPHSQPWQQWRQSAAGETPGGWSRADVSGSDRAYVNGGHPGGALLPTPQATVSTYSSSGYGPNLNEVAVTLMPTPKACDGDYGLPRTSGRPPEKSAHLATRLAYTDHSVYADAIAGWEKVTGRRAPSPTEPAARAGGRPRLSARFVEWMMGLPDGWVTSPDVGLSRSAALRALGNGVVPQQASAAVSALLERERAVGVTEGWPEFAS